MVDGCSTHRLLFYLPLSLWLFLPSPSSPSRRRAGGLPVMSFTDDKVLQHWLLGTGYWALVTEHCFVTAVGS